MGLVALLVFLAAGAARAQDDPPGRVGRVADVQGPVSWFDHFRGQWRAAERHLPLTSGDRVSTGAMGRAELRVGSTTLRLDGKTELEVLRLDDQRLVFQLHSGSLGLRVRSREVAAEVEVLTAEARLRPLRAGHYRVDRLDDTSYISSWRGELQVDEPYGITVAAGQRAELWREGPGRTLRQTWAVVLDDAFGARVAMEDQREERSVASRFVSPEMTGAEDLDRYGRWDTHPEYGAVWSPLQVRAGWAPYRYGRWTWVRTWGWTWVDETPWGFAPFHYGRWVHWRDRWGWVPGTYVARPVYAPALVAWVGGPGFGVSINIGGPVLPSVGWVPLAPREVYVPWFVHTPVYLGRVNEGPAWRNARDRDRRSDWRMDGRLDGRSDGRHSGGPANAMPFANQNVPGAVTMVPRDGLGQRQPLPRGGTGYDAWRGVRPDQPLNTVSAPMGPPRPEFLSTGSAAPNPQPLAPQPTAGTMRPLPQAQPNQPEQPGRSNPSNPSNPSFGSDRASGAPGQGGQGGWRVFETPQGANLGAGPEPRRDRDRDRDRATPPAQGYAPAPAAMPPPPAIPMAPAAAAAPAAAPASPISPAMPPPAQDSGPAGEAYRGQGPRRQFEAPRLFPAAPAAPAAPQPQVAVPQAAPARSPAPSPATVGPQRPSSPAAAPAAPAAPRDAPVPREEERKRVLPEREQNNPNRESQR